MTDSAKYQKSIQDTTWHVAVQFTARDGVRELPFFTEEQVKAPTALNAIARVLDKIQAHRAVPGTLKVLVMAL